MENIPDTPEGIILESLLEGMNQYYSAELAQKVKRGMRETRLKGNFQGGIIPYGYRLNNKKLEIDENHAVVVNYIFSQYSIDVSVSSIIKELTQKGVLYNNKPFKPNVIYAMLKNEKYTGNYRFDNQIYTNIYPQIIELDLFEKVRKKTEKIKLVQKAHKQFIYLEIN